METQKTPNIPKVPPHHQEFLYKLRFCHSDCLDQGHLPVQIWEQTLLPPFMQHNINKFVFFWGLIPEDLFVLPSLEPNPSHCFAGINRQRLKMALCSLAVV